jgi:DNA-binding NarL/FixJ family response regulator
MAAPLHTRNLAPTPVRLFVATGRPAVARLFAGARTRIVATVPVSPDAPAGAALALLEADVAVVDAGLEPALAAALCAELRARRPELPIAAVICCPHAVTPWDLRRLLAAGATALVDLQLGEQEAARTIEVVASGASILHLQLRRGHREFLREILGDRGHRGTHSLQLLELVALGLPDHEIGRRLHLSPHTVKRHIEQLRSDLGLRNRLELAAWAGRHGFYPGARSADSVPVHVTHPGP